MLGGDFLYKIIICDDNQEDQKTVYNCLDKFSDTYGTNFQIVTIVKNGPDLINFLKENNDEPFIIIQDILLDKTNSIDLITDHTLLFNNSQIIFITNSKSFRKRIYKVSHTFYLEKNELDEYFDEALKQAISNINNSQQDFVSFTINNKPYIFKTSNIISIERDKRVIKIIGNNIDETIYCKLDDIAPSLDNRFIRCHNSIFINFENVYKFEKDHFVMVDGRILNISRSKKNEVMEQINNLILNV